MQNGVRWLVPSSPKFPILSEICITLNASPINSDKSFLYWDNLFISERVFLVWMLVKPKLFENGV